MQRSSLLFVLSIFVAGTCFTSCKKSAPATPPTPLASTPPIPISDDVLKDSALYYARDIYLWNTQIPSTFNAKSYSDPDKVMTAIRQYSIEPGFSQPVDKYSFAIKQVEWDNISAGLGSVGSATSTDGDFGLTVFFRVQGDLRVSLVEPQSPAGVAGIKRSWRITKINGNTDINTTNSSFIIDNVYNAASVTITFLKPDGASVDINLNRGHYTEKPVYLDTVLSINGKKAGYLVFNSFLGKMDDIYTEFQRVFSKFAVAGVSDVIVDLRYNGGGFVSVQEKLANYLVSTSANGSVMMTQTYNAQNSSSNRTTKFIKEGTLNLGKIYFIVGKSTASASELLINNLRPYMDVRLVGNTTYGKPVGFFPIPVGEWYIFPVSFRTTNKNGEGNYFNGLTVNSKIADGLDKDWGDQTEASLANVIKNITTGAFKLPADQPYIEPIEIAAGNKILDEPRLKATIGDLKSFK